ncbi:MAG: hypothetical protein R3335_04720 [Anaerolineales bacterium]|nr:hypothetical protein [Anaerolineales bacterium]
MNPYTKSLLDQIDNPELARFVTLWDVYEAMAIEIFRRGACEKDTESAYRALLTELNGAYPAWQDELAPHWRASRIKGEATARDPFPPLLGLNDCTAWVDNQDMLRLLPAAREAINLYLTSLVE